MGEALQATLNSQSTIVIPGNTPLTLDDFESAWIVEAGKLDVFLVRAVEGELAGPRHHVLRAEIRDSVFGVSASPFHPLVLIGVASPGTRLLRVNLRSLREREANGEVSLSAVTLVEGWVTHLSAALAPEAAPKSYTILEAGKRIRVSAKKSAVSVRQLVWVKHVQGGTLFLGDAEAGALKTDDYFPVTSHTWLTAQEDTTLECYDTASYLAVDLQWTGLNHFHQAALATLHEHQLRTDKRDSLRLREKQASTWRQMHFALRRLAAPLGRARAKREYVLEKGADPLVAACQIAGAAAGIEIRTPPRNPDGSPLSDPLRAIARASNIRMRRVLLRDRWWKDEHGPLVAYLQEGRRPVALVRGSNKGYELHDPADGTKRPVNSEIAHALEPFAESLYRPFPDKPLGKRDLLSFGLANCGPELASILLTGIAGGLIALVVPIVTGTLFDTVIPGAQHSALRQFMFLLLVGALATGLFEATRNLALQRLEGKMGSVLQAAIWDRLLSLPVSFFRQYSAGDLADRANGIDAIRSVLTGTVTNSIVSGIFSVFNLGLMFYYSWKLAVVGLSLVIVALLATLGFGSAQARRSRPYAKTAGWLSGQVLEFMNGVSKLRASGTEAYAFATWAKGYSRQKQLSTRTRNVSNHFSIFNSFYFVFGPMTIFFTVDQWTGRLSAGDFLAFNAAFGQMFSATMTLGSAVIQMMSLRPHFERAIPILTSAVEANTAKADPGDLAGEIEMSNISFRYREDTPLVLKDVSLRIEAGQFVAFVGPSGSGKSTLFRLLLGFETPEAGSVFYDGQDLKGLDVNSLRRRMGVVLQNSTLFRGDLFSNIVGSKPLTLDDAWEAARLCGLFEDIKQMPMGMHTMVSEGGGGLSGGQRQRLMIARAIVSRPRILLFDEATSALDNQTQAIVSASLAGLKATRVVIAHRLSTVLNADRIFVLDQGCLVQSGTYSELIEQGGVFADLAKRQLA